MQFSYEKYKSHIVNIAYNAFCGTGLPLLAVWVFYYEKIMF
jgi:hypothetical protein